MRRAPLFASVAIALMDRIVLAQGGSFDGAASRLLADGMRKPAGMRGQAVAGCRP